MTRRLSEIEGRMATAHQLDAVIGAMRGIAAAREREAQARLAGIRSVAATVGEAIGRVLAATEHQGSRESPPERYLAPVLIVLCTEQGFVGAFNERLLECVESWPSHGTATLFVVGTRGAALADERGLVYDWSVPMASHAGDVMRVAGRISDAVFARFDAHPASAIWLIHALAKEGAQVAVVTRRLVPFDFDRFKSGPRLRLPLLTLPTGKMLAGLAERYVYVELCEGLMLSFAAENAARMTAMLAASDHVGETLKALTREARIVRQDEITTEIVELAVASAPVPGSASGTDVS
ncbi:FoF1 ATP synthase subunit gamma [Paraburkholderia phymatum]|uniref:H+transporting two-sector ATPase gamma subunit n=1 Tax=Paraburkholderia phymatum (strain DSM 17167 / CIP 108236 / LMG 21445 / STM815) TaxID=391038 RepID=B2JH72_PARP8|nr:FoF1 ATP synthase subunit gamma [Paraburkholderia phymatum]ACC70310.1 H+transporting two-sector ATPase gamma subunit [Paraburkholderia phymatum STM815]